MIPSLLLLCGAALGPAGLAILTPRILAFLDPAAPVALAVFGILAAMRMQTGRVGREAVGAAALQATITGVAVAGGFLLVQPPVWNLDAAAPWTVTAIALGIAAATSLDAEDCLVPIAAGGLLLAFTRDPATADALLLTLQVAAIAAVIGASGWLILSRASTTDEQRVSTFASALLLGGAADYLSMSALLCGVTAGGCWRQAGAAVRETIVRDLSPVTDSLLAFTLVLAGAHASYSQAALVIGVAYAVLRFAGMLTGDRIARAVCPDVPRAGSRLLAAPGAFGVAFALNLVRAFGDPFAPVLGVVVIGTLIAAAIAAFPRSEREA
jgi:stage V sporulation protein SpoVS